MTPVELALARGRALEILQAWLDRERKTAPTSAPAYMVDDLLLSMLAHHGYPLMKHELNGSVMTYLRDLGAVEYKTQQPAGPKGPTLLMWRITAAGLALLEGTKQDPGVKVM